ncbi:MAG: hypothetical protein ACYC4T_10250 [Melioribacteraceae bacterium]
MSKKFEIEVKIMEKYFRHLNSQDIILREIKSYKVLHGGGFRYQNDEKEAYSPIREIMTDIVYKYDEITKFDLESFCSKLYEMIRKRIEQLHKLMYEEITTATDLTGNKVDARGSKFNPEFLLEMLEKIEIRFDENGEPIMPQLHVSPETYKQIKDFNYTPEQEKRHKDIIENKKKLWYAKKCYRKLSYIY